MKKIFEFNGSAELLGRLLKESDMIDQIVSESGGGKVRMVVEVKRPALQVEDDLHWNEHHEARMDRIGQNGGDGLHYNDPEYQKEIQRYRNSKPTEMHLRETRSHDWMEGDDAEVVGV